MVTLRLNHCHWLGGWVGGLVSGVSKAAEAQSSAVLCVGHTLFIFLLEDGAVSFEILGIRRLFAIRTWICLGTKFVGWRSNVCLSKLIF